MDLDSKPPRQPNDAYVIEGLQTLLTAREGDPTLYDGTLANLALWEAFKMVQDLPGSVVELGVFKGQSLLMFAKFMELMNPNDRIGHKSRIELVGGDVRETVPANRHLECVTDGIDLDRYEEIRVEADLGDVVVFHSNILHRSEKNYSTEGTRIVQLFRFSDLNDPEAVRIGWDSADVTPSAKKFEEVYPEKVMG